jgi:excisionase family DNA binding protein
MPQQTALPATLPPRLVSREAAAAYVCVSPNTFDKMVDDGRMPHHKHYRLPRTAVLTRCAAIKWHYSET